MRRGLPRRRLRCYLLLYVVLLAGIIWQFVASGDFTLGRRPWQNLQRTAHELSRPSFLDVWFGDERLEYRAEDGRVLRVENQRSAERRFLRGLAAAVWTTFTIATLGSLLVALVALPFGLVSAKNMRLPRPVATAARFALSVSRAIHTLVFGLIIVGIIGLGPMAGVLAIAAHSFGSYGKLYAETVEAIDARWIESGVALGLTPLQTLIHGLRITLLPRWLSVHLYIWEYNVRDSTVLGLIGAGGLGLLVSEAVSLFQWGRLATILIAIVLLVVVFDAVSRKVRHDVLEPAR
ncbi:MAG: ABC transporter permease subunit [Burkholderiales bacterium]